LKTESRMIMIMDSSDQPHDQALPFYNHLTDNHLRHRKSRALISARVSGCHFLRFGSHVDRRCVSHSVRALRAA
jgi:hypothetical protein